MSPNPAHRASPAAPSSRPSSHAAVAELFERPTPQNLDAVARAGAGALAFLAGEAGADEGLSSLPAGVAVGRPDALTPALVLGWLPTLPKAAKRSWLDRLDALGETPRALFADGPPRLEAEAARVLAEWRARGERAKLRQSALRLLASSLEECKRHELDPAQVAWILHPVLLAARLAGLRLEETRRLKIHRRSRWLRPLDVVRHHLESLADFLLEADLHHGTPACPSPEWILCLCTELWRETTPWSAGIRTPLEVAVWERWRRLRHAQDLPASTLAALLVAAENLHIDVDLASLRWRLAALQQPDGSFPAGPLITLHPGPRHLGSKTLTTTLAARALTGQPRTGGAWLP